MKKNLYHYVLLLSLFSFSILQHCCGQDQDINWATWRSKVPDQYAVIHEQLAQREMVASHQTRDSSKNHALFQLMLYEKGNPDFAQLIISPEDIRMDDKVDDKAFSFPSGKYIFAVNPDPDDTTPLEKRCCTFWDPKTSKSGVKAKRTSTEKIIKEIWPTRLIEEYIGLAKAESFSQHLPGLKIKLDSLVEQFRKLVGCDDDSRLLNSVEEAWKGNLAYVKVPMSLENKKPDLFDSKGGHIYDSEQLIMAYVDDYFKGLIEHSEDQVHQLLQNGGPYYFGLHLHSLRDMCPFCLYSLHIKIREWREFFQKRFGDQVSLMAIVSSRLEYTAADFPFLYELYASYRGTMRSIFMDEHFEEPLTEDKLLTLAQQGRVIQVAFDPSKLYATSPSVGGPSTSAASSSSSN